MAKHNVLGVGTGLTVVLEHSLILAGAALSLTGFKLEGQFLSTDQLIDNSKIVPLLNGDTVTITNTNKSGTLNFNCTRSSNKLQAAGTDIVRVANELQTLGDNTGGTFTVSYGFNGTTFTVKFYGCTVRRCPPLLLAGNDVPDYGVSFNYADFEIIEAA